MFENDRITKIIDSTDDINAQDGMSSTRGNFGQKTETVFDPMRKPIKEEADDEDKNSRQQSGTTARHVTNNDGFNKDSNNEDTIKGYNMTSKRVETNILKLNPYTKFINIDD